jgi:hypothetical protein
MSTAADMKVFCKDFVIPTWTTWTARFRLIDNLGVPITVFTGWTAIAQVRDTPDSPVLHEWSTATPAEMAFEDEYIVLNLTPVDTLLWTFTRARYDVNVQDNFNRRARVAMGMIVPSYSISEMEGS